LLVGFMVFTKFGPHLTLIPERVNFEK